ncbi:MAG: zincin-like metallopeptidase domain-containing protein [Alphaproteobacteria bacterium]
MGRHVMKGEHGETACHADTFIPKAKRERAARDGDDPKRVPFLKRIALHLVQRRAVRGSAGRGLRGHVAAFGSRDHSACRASDRGDRRRLPCRWHRGVLCADQNFIRVPPQPAFFEQINYYRTCFHELGHYADSRIMQRRLLTLLVSKTFQHSISA